MQGLTTNWWALQQTAQAIEQMLVTIKTLKVKPKKGRGKDLVRIQDLVEAASLEEHCSMRT